PLSEIVQAFLEPEEDRFLLGDRALAEDARELGHCHREQVVRCVAQDAEIRIQTRALLVRSIAALWMTDLRVMLSQQCAEDAPRRFDAAAAAFRDARRELHLQIRRQLAQQKGYV